MKHTDIVRALLPSGPCYARVAKTPSSSARVVEIDHGGVRMRVRRELLELFRFAPTATDTPVTRDGVDP